MLNLLELAALISAISLSLFTLVKWPGRFWIAYLVGLAFSGAVFLLFHTFMPALAFVIAVISARALYTRRFFFIMPLLLIIGVALYALRVRAVDWELFDMAVGLGTAVSLLSDRESLHYTADNDKSKGSDRHREITRDLVQIGGGIAMILLVLIMGEGHGRIAITMAVFPFYLVGNYYSLFPTGTIAKTLLSLERKSTPLGMGAIWFAAGMLMAMGMVHSTHVLAVIIFATTIGDPMATLFGIRIRSPRIPYNRRKSVAGFMAIFIFSGIFGYFMIGPAGLGIGIISAVVESMAYYPFDDNLILPVILGAVGSVI
jgi:dolichol kinase